MSTGFDFPLKNRKFSHLMLSVCRLLACSVKYQPGNREPSLYFQTVWPQGSCVLKERSILFAQVGGSKVQIPPLLLLCHLTSNAPCYLWCLWLMAQQGSFCACLQKDRQKYLMPSGWKCNQLICRHLPCKQPDPTAHKRLWKVFTNFTKSQAWMWLLLEPGMLSSHPWQLSNVTKHHQHFCTSPDGSVNADNNQQPQTTQ